MTKSLTGKFSHEAVPLRLSPKTSPRLLGSTSAPGRAPLADLSHRRLIVWWTPCIGYHITKSDLQLNFRPSKLLDQGKAFLGTSQHNLLSDIGTLAFRRHTSLLPPFNDKHFDVVGRR
jgi:hypothetical protein